MIETTCTCAAIRERDPGRHFKGCPQRREAAAKFDYETIKDPSVTGGATPGVHYRVRDVTSDNRIATCFDRANAEFVVRALNALGQDYMTEMRSTFARERTERT
jgi:hypothetical protein